MTLQDLCDAGRARRAQLPLYPGGLICQEFLRFGKCSLFNRHGRCSLHHPKDIHTVVDYPRRCPQCTLVWPCEHCTYSTARQSLLSFLATLKLKITKLKKVAVPNPPLNLVARMVSSTHRTIVSIVAILLTYILFSLSDGPYMVFGIASV